MSCPHCGCERVTGNFCSECGRPLAQSCSSCQGPLALGAKFCPECGTPKGDFPPPSRRGERDAGERRQLTVVFCDLVGSTELSARLDPEEWSDLVQAYQEATATVVERHGGYIAQYLGDGVLAYFGYPQAHENAAERAVRAGLGMLGAVRDVNAGIAADRQLAMRVGIHTGSVVVSQLGGGARYEAVGEAMNLAARLQGLALPNTVVMSASTQRLVPGIFVVQELGVHELKGIAQPVACYRPLRPSGVRSRLDIAAGRLTRFVGRDVELGALLGHWKRVTDGHCERVLLVGEAGVGKSRLVYELRRQLAGEPHTWLECRPTTYTQGTPFLPVAELVGQAMGFEPGDGPSDKIARLERGLAESQEPLTDGVPIIARLLGLPVPGRYPSANFGPDVERQRTLETLSTWILTLTRVQPLVLLAEDLHWCDASSLQLLERLAVQDPAAKLLLIGTARPEFESAWTARTGASTLALGRLGNQQAREMVTALSGALPGDTVDALVARADGVPLYIEELTKVTAQAGATQRAEEIPTTLADSLITRLDRLSTAKEVAQRAAVLGREFSYQLLMSVAEMDEAELRRGLARLVEAEIVFARGEPPLASYTFKHALVQEAAYESVLRRVRQRLHARVCDVLAGVGMPAEAEVQAHHAERAGRIDDAIGHLARAGGQAQERSAHTEAIRHYEKAIALWETGNAMAASEARLVDVDMGLGLSLAAVRGYGHPATRAVFERAAARAERCRAPGMPLTRLGVAVSEMNGGELERAHKRATDVLEGAGPRLSDVAVFARGVITANETWLGRFRSSLGHGERTLAEYELLEHGYFSTRMGVPGLVSICTACSLAHLGRLDAAQARAAESVVRAERSSYPFNLALALGWGALVQLLCGNHAAQRETAAQAIAVSDRFGFPVCSSLGRVLHGAARISAGDEHGLADLLDGIDRAARARVVVSGTMGFGLLAAAQHRLGRVDEAQGALAMAMALIPRTGERWWEAELHVMDAALARAKGAPLESVIDRLRRARTVARGLDSLRSELVAAMAMAHALRDDGHPAAALDELAPVYAKFTEGFGTPLLAAAKTLLGELALEPRRA